MFILESIISIVAPHHCLVCGGEGSVVCAWCLPDLAPAVPARCFGCQKVTPDSLVCRSCRRLYKLKHVWVRTDYDGVVKQLVHGFKFQRKAAAAEPIARLIAEALPYLAPNTLITHVPTASSRVRRRGYDHARLIAKELARQLGLPYAPLLVRHGQVRQVGAKRQRRLHQLAGAYTVIKTDAVTGARILLIDDITTTGGTLGAASACLREAGAAVVDAAVLAQKQ